MNEMKVRATKDQIIDFKSSFLWKDIKRELKSWQRGFKNEYAALVTDAIDSNHSSANILMHLGDINGRNKTVDYVLNLPDLFITSIESKNYENKD